MNYTLTPEQLSLLKLARTTWERRSSIRRHNLFFSEETITETILLDLVDTFPGSVVVVPFKKADEGKVGADWAWTFLSARADYNVPMLVQAKVLDSRDVEYPEIKRMIGKKRVVRQIDRLIQSATKLGWPALYAFYNHVSDADRVPINCRSLGMVGKRSMPESWGISVADAHNVRAVLNDQSFDTHRQHSVALHCLLCSRGSGSRPTTGSPGLALAALRRLRELSARGSHVSEDLGRPFPLPTEPFRELPEVFQLARQIAAIENIADQEALRRKAAQRFTAVAGVVVLQDSESER